MARMNEDGKIVTYDIWNDATKEVTVQDVEQWERATAAFGAWREGNQYLADLALLFAQGKTGGNALHDVVSTMRAALKAAGVSVKPIKGWQNGEYVDTGL